MNGLIKNISLCLCLCTSWYTPKCVHLSVCMGHYVCVSICRMSVCISQSHKKYTLSQSRSQTQWRLSGTLDEQCLRTTYTDTHTLWEVVLTSESPLEKQKTDESSGWEESRAEKKGEWKKEDGEEERQKILYMTTW